MSEPQPIKVGQVWQSRDLTRRVEVISAPTPGAWTNDFITVQGQRRKSTMRANTLRSRYMLARDTP